MSEESMYYFTLVFTIIVLICSFVSIGNYIRLAIRLFKGLTDKISVIKEVFLTAFIAWMFIYFHFLVFQGDEFLEPNNIIIFISTYVPNFHLAIYLLER